jgi:hypothetical protein
LRATHFFGSEIMYVDPPVICSFLASPSFGIEALAILNAYVLMPQIY